MTNKKNTIIRLVIYLLIAFAVPFIMIFIYIAKCGWTTEGSFYGIICSVSMLCPAIANILTRVITKEGTDDLMLNLNFKGNLRYYGIALVMPVISAVFVVLGATLFLLPGTLGEVLKNTDYGQLLASVLYLASASVSAVMFGFGEEFGWRGYLTPKLEKLMPAPAAILVTGIIWGLWHAPLIACGHNFGKGYNGDPWLGIILMCVSCIGLSFYLSAITKATGSSLAAGFAHIGINNMTSSVVMLFLSGLSEENMMKFTTEQDFASKVLFMGVMTAVGVIFGAVILLMIKKKQNN